MATDAERRVRTQGYIDDVVRNLTTSPKGSSQQFVVNNAIVQAWNRVSPDGIRWHGFVVGRVVEVNGEPSLHSVLRPADLDAARVALKRMKKWWMSEYRRLNPPWWRKLGKLIGLR